MESTKVKLLTLLKQEYGEYCAIPVSEVQKKSDKKSFINGLMTASRVVGVSFEELNEIVGANTGASFVNVDDTLAIPTYIRNKVEIGQ
ncbi:hypothetical protein [Vibrio rarus]|uniref:hypothetical protein n=1 Tax=Vibrio rarus TaxID=413403 RepID=UPI0021C27DB1|nr:hypothetical protein [Vibrio rarus]